MSTLLDVTLHRSASPLDRDPALEHIVALASLCVDLVPQVSSKPHRAARVRAIGGERPEFVWTGKNQALTLQLGADVQRRHGLEAEGLESERVTLHVSLYTSRKDDAGEGGGARAGFWACCAAPEEGAGAKRALLARTAPVPVSRLAGGAPRSCALDIGGFVELTVSLRAKAPKPPKRRRRGGEKGHEKGAGAADAGAPAAALLGPSDGAQL